MPRFPGCEGMESDKVMKKCADEKMLQYLYANLKYPKEAKKNKVQGTCIVSFNIEPDGTLQNIKVTRDIGSGCGEEAYRVVNSMNDLPERWTPGMQRGKKVAVHFTLPVRFKL